MPRHLGGRSGWRPEPDIRCIRGEAGRSFSSCSTLVASGFVGGHASGEIFHKCSLTWASPAKARGTAGPTSGTARMTKSSTASTARLATDRTMLSTSNRLAEMSGICRTVARRPLHGAHASRQMNVQTFR